jgi:hypothetical protein
VIRHWPLTVCSEKFSGLVSLPRRRHTLQHHNFDCQRFGSMAQLLYEGDGRRSGARSPGSVRGATRLHRCAQWCRSSFVTVCVGAADLFMQRSPSNAESALNHFPR